MHANSIEPQSFITLHYRLRCKGQDFINTFADKPATFTLGAGTLAPALEELLLGLREGERQHFHLESSLAFGERHPDKLQWVSGRLLDELSPDSEATYQVGDVVQFPQPNSPQTYAATVLQVEQSRVLFDFNHPLAGQALDFEVHILGVL